MSVADRAQAEKWVGRAMKRKEDPKLITGRGNYVEDISLPGTLWASFVRSPEAHARIVSIDTSAVEARDDIVLVATGEDVDGLAGPLPMAWIPPGVDVNTPEHWPLAKGTVKHVGDPVAVVIGTDRYAVVDAADEVAVEYDPLPVVVDPEEALKDETIIHEGLGTNVSHRWSLGGGDLEAGFAEADHIIERRVVNHRTAGGAIEPRGVLADYRGDELTIWTSTQVPHFVRLFLGILLGISQDRVRAVAPDVGGGFGSKLQMYGEEVLLCWAARKLERPVKWIETRSENMQVCHHGRDQIAKVRMGVKNDGSITAFHADILADFGAYHMLLTPTIPSLGAFVMQGCYKMPAVQTDITGVFTNKFSTDAIRGAGRPEATHMIETVLDQAAAELGMDPVEIRRKNFIPADAFPFETTVGVVYDSGNYQGTLDRLLEHLDLPTFRAEQERLRRPAHLPRRRLLDLHGDLRPRTLAGHRPDGLRPAGRRLGVGGRLRPHHRGGDRLHGHLAARPGPGDELRPDRRRPRRGRPPTWSTCCTATPRPAPRAWNTYGSRSLAVGGESIARSAEKIQAKVKRIVAHQLEADPADIELRDGKFSVKGSPDKGMTLAEVAGQAYIPLSTCRRTWSPGWSETTFYDPDNFVFPFGAHAAIVDVDVETGKVDVVRYLGVDDCGPAINPKIIDGQLHGGICHAIGQALYERVHYDDDGQLVTGTFVDYALPSAAEIPSFELDRTETPTPTNTLGVKGVGEAGTIGASAAVTNAVIDALRPVGVTWLNMPLSPSRVWAAIQEARG